MQGHRKKYICDSYWIPQNTPAKLVEHQTLCTFNVQRVTMPKKSHLEFKITHKQLRRLYVLYSLLKTLTK